jgi:hypothetical protein
MGLFGFSVDVDGLVIGLATVVPADKTTLSPPKLKRNWDIKPGFGIQGAFCVYTGEGLAAFDAVFEFWSEEMEPLWDAFAAIYLSAPKGVKPAAMGIYHPTLVTPGKWQTRLSFLEYRPPAPFRPMKTEPVVPAVEKVPVARPKTEQDVRMQAASARLAAAAAAGTK